MIGGFVPDNFPVYKSIEVIDIGSHQNCIGRDLFYSVHHFISQPVFAGIVREFGTVVYTETTIGKEINPALTVLSQSTNAAIDQSFTRCVINKGILLCKSADTDERTCKKEETSLH